MEEKKFYTLPELAKVLGISRIAVFKKVKRGKINAIRIGRNWVVPAENINHSINKTTPPTQEQGKKTKLPSTSIKEPTSLTTEKAPFHSRTERKEFPEHNAEARAAMETPMDSTQVKDKNSLDSFGWD